MLAMHDIEDYTLPELAQIMEIPLGTLKSRLHRARARLRELPGRGTNERGGPCMKVTGETGPYVADDDFQTLRQALRRMPTPEPRAGFVERALARAAAQQRTEQASLPARLRRFLSRWETWTGAALGAAAAAAMTLILLRPVDTTESARPQLALTLHETRNIDVLINSERELKGATIRIAATGSIALDGFDDEQHIDWQADLSAAATCFLCRSWRAARAKASWSP